MTVFKRAFKIYLLHIFENFCTNVQWTYTYGKII